MKIKLSLILIIGIAGYLAYQGFFSTTPQNQTEPTEISDRQIQSETSTEAQESVVMEIVTKQWIKDYISNLDNTDLEMIRMFRAEAETGNGYSYQLDGLKLKIQFNQLTVFKNDRKLFDQNLFNADAVINGSHKENIETFVLDNKNIKYFILRGIGCYNTYCDHELSFYHLDTEGNFSSIISSNSEPLFVIDRYPEIEGVMADKNRIYFIIGYGNNRTAIVLDKNGNFETKVTGSYQKGIDPPGLIEPTIERLLQLQRG